MITGHNTEVEYAGRVYHIQTEDRGEKNPIIETLIYSRGEILDTKRTSYAELLERGAGEAEIMRLIDEQHRRWVREARNGRYDPDGPRPFGYGIITSRSFDEVVLDTLQSGALAGELDLEFTTDACFYGGAKTPLDLTVLDAGRNAASGARVRVRLLRTSGKPLKLFEGHADAEGRVCASVDVPAMDGGEGVILIQAEASGAVAEVRRPVLKQ